METTKTNQIVQGVYQVQKVALIVYRVKVEMKMKTKMKKVDFSFIRMELRV